MRSMMPLAVGICFGLVSISGQVIASQKKYFSDPEKLRFLPKGTTVDFASDVVFKEKQSSVVFKSRGRGTTCSISASPVSGRRLLQAMQISKVSGQSGMYVDRSSRKPVNESSVDMMLYSTDPEAVIPVIELKCKRKHVGSEVGSSAEVTVGELRQAVSSAIVVFADGKNASGVVHRPENLERQAEEKKREKEKSRVIMTITGTACDGTDMDLCL